MYIVHNHLCSERFSTPLSPPGYPFLRQYFLIQFRSGSSGWRATLSTFHKLCKTNRIEVLTFCRQKLPSFTRREFHGSNEIPHNKTIQAWARGFRRQESHIGSHFTGTPQHVNTDQEKFSVNRSVSWKLDSSYSGAPCSIFTDRRSLPKFSCVNNRK